MLRLRCGFQPYDWGKLGKDSTVAQLLQSSGNAVAPEKRYAELWMGTHPSLPSYVSESGKLLSDAIRSDSHSLLGEPHIKEFGNDIPFLFKVLSIDKALSIQAHPDKSLAEILHKKDPKNYPDANHKPELVVALTDYEALCCFRPLQEIAAFLASIAPLRRVIATADELIQAASEPETPAKTKTLLRAALGSLYSQPAAVLQETLKEHLGYISGKANPTDEEKVFVRIHSQFPGDVGCWMVYILNLVKLRPGDGLFLAANEPHSYLSGDSVEIMAASDNVVRAGLTPKFKDVPTLLEMLTYRTDSLQGVHFKRDGERIQTYAPPASIREFQLTAVRLKAKETAEVGPLHCLQIGIVIKGNGTVNGEPIQQGDIIAFPVNSKLNIEGQGHGVELFLGGNNSTPSHL